MISVDFWRRMMSKAEILIVEDETIIGMDVKATLENFNYNVPKIICKGEDAIEYVQRNPPDLVLMDIVLAGELDGIDAAKHINHKYNLPTVFLTAQTHLEILKKAYDCHPYGYVLKPINDLDLVYTIDTALLHHRMETELRKENEELIVINNILKNMHIHFQSGNEPQNEKEFDYHKFNATLHSIFERISQPVALCQMIYDEEGNPLNFLIREFNEKFSHEINPRIVNNLHIKLEKEISSYKSTLLSKLHQVFDAGEPVHFQSSFGTDKSYRISVYAYDKEYMILLLSPLT